MKVRSIFFLILITLSSVSIYSQKLKKFSSDIYTYPEEIKNFVGENLTKEQEEFFDEFYSAWDTTIENSLFTDNERTRIIEVSNLFLKNKARPIPHFYNYFSDLITIKKKLISDEKYLLWENGLKKMLSNKKVRITSINQFLLTTKDLINEKIIHKSSSVIWKSSSDNYQFVIKDDNSLRIIFNNIDLSCYSKRDSLNIFNTSGEFDPIANEWYGNKGEITWERAGLSSDVVYAELNNYKIHMKRSDYSADSVIFHNTFYFDYSLIGKLDDKVKLITNPQRATYPRFQSYRVNFKLKDLYENIDYEGGLTMQGANLIGSGSTEKDAKLFLYYNDTLFMTAASKYFVFTEQKIDGIKTSIKINLDRDSIYHPDLKLTYLVNTKEVSLVRTDDFTSQGPYYDSYHNMDMNFEELYFVLGEPKLYFKMLKGSAIGNANFESANYFNYNRFEKLQLLDAQHPLFTLKKYSNKIHSIEFNAVNYSQFMKLPVNSIRKQMMSLSFKGFIFYDSKNDLIKLKPKLFSYLDASIGKIDYDVIDFHSKVQSPVENASINLNTLDLTINGVPEIHVSDSQNVVITPTNATIIMKKNLNFQFDGVVNAGLLTFYGKNFFFNYDSFKVNLQNIDSLRMKVVVAKDNYNFDVTRDISNLIEHITGEVIIDQADNKSSIKRYPEYPIFNSRERSYVYYDKQNIQGGVYKRGNFYFEVYPFSIDSLDNFTKEGLGFAGRFISGGIIPTFEDTLRLQADFSLGFTRKTPQQGVPIYGGKAVFHNDIILSNEGLQGKGQFDYITSTSYSDLFRFYPDSMNTITNEFKIDKKVSAVEYPHVNSKDNKIHWEPNNDNFYIFQRTEPLHMFNNNTSLQGSLNLTSQGLKGKGFLDFKTADLNSQSFRFKSEIIDADTSDFNLKSLNTSGIMVKTLNVKSHVDFIQRKGEFYSNEEFSLVEFPRNKYISFLDYFLWDMNKKELAMGAKTTRNNISQSDSLKNMGPRYISVKPSQDSLEFTSTKAFYNYEYNVIKATKVPYIDVADARIFPDKGELTVKQDAVMKTLENANIITDRISKFHKIHTAKINISGKYSYSGEGDYDYVDENNKIQIIHFNDIQVDTAIQTIANAEIIEPDSFKLSPVYNYQGGVHLFAKNQFLNFKGAVLVEHDCEVLPHNWMTFESEINPQLIYIPVKENPKDINRKELYVGPMMCHDSIHIYPAFLTPHKDYFDTYIATSNGLMFYDIGSKEYRISNKEKLFDKSLPGNYISFNRFACTEYGEGKIDLGIDIGQIKLNSVGNVMHEMDSNSTEFNLMMSLDFYMNVEALQIMANEIDSFPYLSAVDLSQPVYLKNVAEIIGKEDADKLQDELKLYGEYEDLPKEMLHTLVLNQLQLKWNNRTKSYRSQGQIGIVSMGKTQINKLVDGFVEITKKRSGDICDIYLKLNSNVWYYFGYTRGVMQTLSSNNEYLSAINELKPKKRKLKVKRGQTPYIYMISTDTRMNKSIMNYNEGNLYDEFLDKNKQDNNVNENDDEGIEIQLNNDKNKDDIKKKDKNNDEILLDKKDEKDDKKDKDTTEF